MILTNIVSFTNVSRAGGVVSGGCGEDVDRRDAGRNRGIVPDAGEGDTGHLRVVTGNQWHSEECNPTLS